MASTPRELLSPAALHVLLSLANGKRHGYGIKMDVEARTEGALSLGPGTLYEAIHRMQKSGWIEETARPKGATGRDARRKFYRLTKLGRRQLQEELERLDGIVRYARSRELLPDSEPT
jgi:PadR family transcriptional regulator PadR